MEIINKQATIAWCKEREVYLDSDNVYTPFYPNECIEIKIPDYPLRSVYLASILVDIYIEEGISKYQGGLASITSYKDLDDAPLELIGRRAIEIIRNDKLKKSLFDYPGHLFNKDDKKDAAIFLFNTIVFYWNSFWLPELGDYIVFKSHDDIIYVLGKDQANVDYFYSKFKECEYDVKKVITPHYLIK